MWYSRIKIAVSKNEANRMIQDELASGRYDIKALTEPEHIKRALIAKYGSEENMLAAIDQAIDEIKKLDKM